MTHDPGCSPDCLVHSLTTQGKSCKALRGETSSPLGLTRDVDLTCRKAAIDREEALKRQGVGVAFDVVIGRVGREV